MTRPVRVLARLRRARTERDSGGYVAVLMTIMMMLLFGMSAFAVDVGNWYVTGHKVQRAADAAALGGVPRLPGDPGAAYAEARKLTSRNGYTDGTNATVVTGLDDQPTRLRVTVATTVQNTFGSLFGIDETTITRSAVADYAGPVPMGSPCNGFGNDPDPSAEGRRGAPCDEVKGQFWANVGSPGASKSTGDAYQNKQCGSEDGCQGNVNLDYAEDGYFYSVTVAEPVTNLVIEAFDPALINVGDTCGTNTKQTQNLDGASEALNDLVDDESERYAFGADSPYCTGDIRFAGGSGHVTTQFTVRNPSDTPWDPLSFPIRDGCQQEFAGFSGNVFDAVDQYTDDGKTKEKARSTFNPTVAQNFRQWRPLCVIPSAEAGTYLIQVKTNGVGNDLASGHNRFALRAYSSSSSTAQDTISIAGYTKMAVYANLPSAQTEFYLARIPSGAAGQVFNVKLFDIGDSTQPGLVQVVAPPDSGVTFEDCKGVGVRNGDLTDCSLTADSTFNGKWQTISVVVPSDYACDDIDQTACWVRLNYDYGSGSAPSDTTSWAASIEGDPVRLIE